jgi:hypothetical protein
MIFPLTDASILHRRPDLAVEARVRRLGQNASRKGMTTRSLALRQSRRSTPYPYRSRSANTTEFNRFVAFRAEGSLKTGISVDEAPCPME